MAQHNGPKHFSAQPCRSCLPDPLEPLHRQLQDKLQLPEQSDYSLAAYLKGFESALETLIFREKNALCKWKMSGVMTLTKSQTQLIPNELTNRIF